MNLGAQLGPVSITKLSPNWACQMGPIHCPKFLLSGVDVHMEKLDPTDVILYFSYAKKLAFFEPKSRLYTE